MLFASIDIQGGKVVQLIQGAQLKLQFDNVEEVVRHFGRWFPLAVIDLDAARGTGENHDSIRRIIRLFPDCIVGGGIRTVERAKEWIRAGAAQVIIGTQAFHNGEVNTSFLEEVVRAIGRQRVVIAVDVRGDRLTTHGWQVTHATTIWDVLPALKPFCSGFLVTHVAGEGMMGGFPEEMARRLLQAVGSEHTLTVAGGIATPEQIQRLTQMGCHIQIGMALYTGKLSIPDALIASLVWSEENSGLIPTLVQDTTGKALMLAYSSRESLRRTIQDGVMWYYSRKRQRLWKKGETSGYVQIVRYLRVDCDQDTLVATVDQQGVACHTGRYTCFGMGDFSLAYLQAQIAERRRVRPPGSYTASLTSEQIRKKLVEEAVEVILAEDRDALRWECADLIYFLTVLMTERGLTWETVFQELRSRMKMP